MADFSYLDSMGNDFAPASGSQFPKLEDIPDGNYDFTILAASMDTTPNTGNNVIRMSLQCGASRQPLEKTYFIDDIEGINRFGGDCATLGLDVSQWGKAIPLSKAIPAACQRIKGLRFKGSKKTSKNNKAFLNINALLPGGGATSQFSTPDNNPQTAAF